MSVKLARVLKPGAVAFTHVHLFVECDPRLAPAHIAAQFKGFTSHELRREFSWLRSQLPSLWIRSYYVGSIGTVSESTVDILEWNHFLTSIPCDNAGISVGRSFNYGISTASQFGFSR